MKRTKARSTKRANLVGGQGSSIVTPAAGNEKEIAKKLDASGTKIPSILFEGDDSAPAPNTSPVQKFAVGADVRGPGPESGAGKLPESYGTGRMLLTARDPQCLYAHWDLTADQQRHYNDLSIHHHLIVRVHRESTAGPLMTEIPVHPESRHLFIDLDSGPGRYVAQLGYYPPGEPWKSIAISGPAVTLAESSVAERPLQFASVAFAALPPAKIDSPPLTEAYDSSSAHLASPESQHAPVLPTLERAFLGFEHAAVAPVPVQTEVPSPASGASAERTEVPIVPSSGRSWPGPLRGPTIVPASVPAWSAVQEHSLAALIHWSLTRYASSGSAEIEELIRGESRPGELSSLQAAAIRQQLPISSAALGEAPPPESRNFWFNVNAELVIYGATESDAQVTIGGRPVRLRPDGTFSFRFALPDGSYQLPVAAVSSHGDLRIAELEFYRGTAYSGDVGASPRDPSLQTPNVENVG